METIGDGSARPGAAGVLDEARRLRRERRYPEALERYQWFHEHALEEEPEMYGVRLSFALADWMELCEEYPEARDALIAVRDAGEAALVSGSGAFPEFDEVVAINEWLGETASRTVDLFKQIEASTPDLAKDCLDLASPALVELGEFAMLSRLLDDPINQFEQYVEMRGSALRAVHGIAMGQAIRNDPGRLESLIRHVEEYFERDLRRLLTTLSRAGRHAEAEGIRERALGVRDDPELRRVISEAIIEENLS